MSCGLAGAERAFPDEPQRFIRQRRVFFARQLIWPRRESAAKRLSVQPNALRCAKTRVGSAKRVSERQNAFRSVKMHFGAWGWVGICSASNSEFIRETRVAVRFIPRRRRCRQLDLSL